MMEVMEEKPSHQDEMNEVCPLDTDYDSDTNVDAKKEQESESDSEPASVRKDGLDRESMEDSSNSRVLCFEQEDENEIPTSCSGEKENEGNLLNSVVTMHNLTNSDDDYSPTLAICDIFSRPKDSPIKNDTPPMTQSKDEDNKDEFLIIDLDTCKMERASKNVNEREPKEEHSSSSCSSNDLVLINLSSHEEVQSDFLNNTNNKDDSENNFLLDTKTCDVQHHDQIIIKRNGKANEENDIPEKSIVKEKNTSEVIQNKTLQQFNLSLTDADIKRENCMQNKGMIFQDVPISDESIISKEMYSSDVSFHSNDLNVSFNSHENQETEPAFYMPELYSRHYEDDDNSAHNSSLETDNGNQFYEYTINNASFDNPPSANLYKDSTTHDFYDQQQTQNSHQYNFESKIISNIVAMEKKNDTSIAYSSRHHENSQPHCYKNRTNVTGVSNKFPSYTTAQEHTSTSPFFHSSYMPPYRVPHLYNKNMQQASDINPQLLSSSTANYSDWNSWSTSPFYEVNLNTFSSVHNMESQCHQGKHEWCDDAVMPNLYHDPEMSIKSSQTEIDSEATEDADETDDVPIFFEESTDFSNCDNLSTMSVMSNSCYSDSSSVMTPMSPSDFTPPPSVSDTPTHPNPTFHDKNAPEDQRCNYPFINEGSRPEPIHLYSPTMLSVTPYKLSNEKVEQNLMNYSRGQGIKRYYPSMADMHNSRSGFSISTPSKFQTDEMFEFPEYRKSTKNQIQSDKISTSTSKNTYDKKNMDITNYANQPLEFYADYIKHEENDFHESRRLRHNEPLRQTAIRIMSQWYEEHLDNPYPTKEDKIKMARDGGITVTQVKSWFANKRNRTNNTKPKVQKRAMKEKLKKLFQDLKHSRSDSLDNSHIIQQLSGIIQT